MKRMILQKTCILALLSMAALWALFGVIFGFCKDLPAFAELFGSLWAPFYGNASPDPVANRLLSFILGVLGATMISWSVLFAGLILYLNREGKRWAWWTLLAGVLTWFIIDESFSIFSGVKINATGNLSLLAGFLIPLIIWRIADINRAPEKKA